MNKRTFIKVVLSFPLFGYFWSTPTRRVINSVRSGNWNDPAIWDRGEVPGLNDDVVVKNGCSVTVKSSVLQKKADRGNIGAYVIDGHLTAT